MKIPREHFTRHGERGMATLILFVLLAVMVVLVAAESSSLLHLRRELQLLERRQIQRLDASQTNSIGRAELPLGQDAQQRVPSISTETK
jgi:type II secretory pathway component PulK